MPVSVRALCAFAARAGDLDLRFTPAPTGLEGAEGHRRVQARRGPGYESEIGLRLECQGLLLRGRADGFDAEAGRLEEIKTHRGPVARVRANQRALHWAQAQDWSDLPALCADWLFRPQRLPHVVITWVGNVWAWLALLAAVAAACGLRAAPSRVMRLPLLAHRDATP